MVAGLSSNRGTDKVYSNDSRLEEYSVNFLDLVRNANWLGRQRVLEYSKFLACIFLLEGILLLLIGADVIRLRSGII